MLGQHPPIGQPIGSALKLGDEPVDVDADFAGELWMMLFVLIGAHPAEHLPEPDLLPVMQSIAAILRGVQGKKFRRGLRESASEVGDSCGTSSLLFALCQTGCSSLIFPSAMALGRPEDTEEYSSIRSSTLLAVVG